jgi:DNA-binding transcriptional MerR regulator
MANDVIYTIKEAARKLHLHEQTLRNWERAGIIKLQRFGKNRSRLFRPNDIERCRWIQRYSGRGISLRGVKALLVMNRQLNGGRL